MRRGTTIVWAVGFGAVALVGCTAKLPKTPCSEMPVGRADSAVVLLTDTGSASFVSAVERIASDPKSTFANKDLGLTGDAGVVVVATYNAEGQVAERAAFNLAGVAKDNTRRRANANAQARCLKEAAGAIDKEARGGDLLRALSPAAAVGRSHTEGDRRVAVLAFGLGRASGDGFEVATADLATAGNRAHVFSELTRVGIMPNFGGSETGLVLVAPSEGVASGISAAGIRAFATDLCARLSPVRCRAAEALE